MYLAIVAILLIVWGIIALKERIAPSAPPIDDLDEHLKHLSSLSNQKERQKYLKSRKPGDK